MQLCKYIIDVDVHFSDMYIYVYEYAVYSI